MSKPHHDAEEVVRRGEEIYEREIRSKIESDYRGQFIVIDIETGDYEIDPNVLNATHRVMARHPDGERCLLRIGSPFAHDLPGIYRA